MTQTKPTADLVKGPTIATYSKSYFNFVDPDSTPVELVDIARGLANTCRYGGQVSRFYSVAEHSVLASYLVEPEHAYDALMHDAAEAFIGDMPKPLKVMLPDYMRFEEIVENSIFRQFSVTNPLPQEIKTVDIQMLILEKEQLLGNYDLWSWTEGVPRPRHIEIKCWSPSAAYAQFLARYSEVRGAMGLV